MNIQRIIGIVLVVSSAVLLLPYFILFGIIIYGIFTNDIFPLNFEGHDYTKLQLTLLSEITIMIMGIFLILRKKK